MLAYVQTGARVIRASVALLSIAAIASCRSLPASHAPPRAAVSSCPARSDVEAERNIVRGSVSSADSTVTQARVRWAIADLVSALNSRPIEDLSVRYDWIGNLTLRDDFLARSRGAGSSTSAHADSSGTWFSDAPGRREQTICVSVDVHWNTLGGVPSTQRFTLQISAVDDGRAAWLSRMRVNRIETQ